MEDYEGGYAIMNIKVQEPRIIKDLFSQPEYERLRDYLMSYEKKESLYDVYFGRYCFHDPLIDEYAKKITPYARKVFGSDTLVPSYSLFAHYEGEKANLFKHVDDNACTYTLDMCVYQNQPWDLWVDDKPYELHPNEALAYYGNDQMHWRESFPNPNSQHVAMIFFHFIEPDHWYITKGPSYLEVIRGLKTEEQWNSEQR